MAAKNDIQKEINSLKSMGFELSSKDGYYTVLKNYNSGIMVSIDNDSGEKYFVSFKAPEKDTKPFSDFEPGHARMGRYKGNPIKKAKPTTRKKAPAKKRVTATKCACTTKPRKKGQRLPWVIGVLIGKQKGYFDGTGFDTDPNKSVLFVSQENAAKTGRTIRGLPRGAKLFVTKKPFGVIR